MITVSVPGKVHLMGEHAVVYGTPALVAAVNRRLTVTVKEGSTGLHIDASEPDAYIRHVVDLVVREQRVDPVPPMTISVTSAFSAGYHLGSSAAVAAGVIGAVTYFLKRIWNPVAMNTLAFEAEKWAHGTPSGADNTAVTFGGFVWYRRELPFLKSIWQLPMKIPAALDHFYLIDTGKPNETTKEMVEQVRARVSSRPSFMQRVFHENELQVRAVAEAIKQQDEHGLIVAMRRGERTLEQMGVVSKKAQQMIRAIERAGGAAKILGGGGRTGPVGYLLAYGAKSKGEKIQLGEEGIRLEERS